MKMEEKEEKNIVWLCIRIGVALTLALLGAFYFTEERFNLWVNLLVMGAAWLLISYDLILESVESIFKEHEFFSESLLMILASIGAFCLRFFGRNEFLEAVLVILLFQVGEVLQDFAEEKSRKAILDAIDLREEKALVKTASGTVSKKAEELAIGDLVLLSTGQKILSDGVIEEGEGLVDEASLTGEFAPVQKRKGDTVSSGTILVSGSLVISVSQEYEDSTVAKLGRMMLEAEEKKSKADRFISRFARVYTPIVLGLAVLIAVIPPLFLGIGDGAVWANWIYVALELLLISCPCAIVIGVPLSYFAGLGLSSKHGIIVKGAEYFDQAHDLGWVCFDKTGTLTEGRFALKETHPEGLEERKFLEYFAAVESRSTHPLAKAMVAAYGTSLADQVENVHEISGQGIEAVYQGRFLKAIKGKESETKGTRIDLYVDDFFSGYAVLDDEIKAGAKALGHDLGSLGLKTCLLSGDKQARADAIKEELGLDEAHGDLLPEGKLARLKEKIEAGQGKVAFCGDGINDAPAIVMADIGIAMGGLGSDMAVANADVALMNDDPRKVATFCRIAKKTRRRAIACIAVSLSIKLVIALLAFIAASTGAFLFPMWAAALADSGLAVAMVLYALLLVYAKPE